VRRTRPRSAPWRNLGGALARVLEEREKRCAGDDDVVVCAVSMDRALERNDCAAHDDRLHRTPRIGAREHAEAKSTNIDRERRGMLVAAFEWPRAERRYVKDE